MRTVVRCVDTALPEMAVDRWLGFAGEDALTLRQYWATVIALSECLENEIHVASAWCDEGWDRLAGVAIGVLQILRDGRRIIEVTIPHEVARAHCVGIWTAQGEDPLLVTQALVEALQARARELAVDRLVISICPAEDPVVPIVAKALRGQPLEARPAYRIGAPPPASYESYLASFRQRDRTAFKRDLRRAEDAGVLLEYQCPPDPERLARAWPLQLDTLRRMQSPLRFCPERNFFTALLERLAPDDLVLAACCSGDTLVGFVLSLRANSTTRLVYVGHLFKPELQTYLAVLTTSIRRELERGAHTLLLGTTNDVYKSRVSTDVRANLNFFIPV